MRYFFVAAAFLAVNFCGYSEVFGQYAKEERGYISVYSDSQYNKFCFHTAYIPNYERIMDFDAGGNECDDAFLVVIVRFKNDNTSEAHIYTSTRNGGSFTSTSENPVKVRCKKNSIVLTMKDGSNKEYDSKTLLR
ncbi:MAG: hypothetical protein EAZ92_00775 [Candidatus Kapaibacterium sp.]|nr:MAG: hypothetical protein EAZ92_00775 [Candidatus Kapabacteria bacterium]